MTVASTISRREYTGDGSTVTFAFNNLIFDDTDLEVYVDGVLKTLTTDYTVSGAGTASNSVTFLSAPANATAVTLLRVVADTQSTDLPAGGAFPSESVETALDRRTVVSQQRGEELDRAIKFKSSDQNLPSAELPTIASLKGYLLGFNAVTGALEARATADLGSLDVDLTMPADGDFLVFDGTNWVNEGGATARTSLGLGALATLATVGAAQIDSNAVTTAKIADDNVTYAKVQDVTATNRILGRITAGAGVIEELTAANVLSILGITTISSLGTALPAVGNLITVSNTLGGSDGVQVTAYMRCTSAEGGYSVGDRKVLNTAAFDGTAEFGWAVVVDTTNISVVRGANSTAILNKGNGQAFTFTAGNWVLDVFAVRFA